MGGKRYSIYKLTAPSGRSYVGFTGQMVAERWRQHVQKAKKPGKHPLYDAIRKYGPEQFAVETLATYATRDEALAAEVEAIAALTGAYNINPGGDDATAAHEAFRENLKDPVWRAAYGRRLSEALKSSPEYQARVPELLANLANWKADNPAEAYRISLRNLRIGVNRHGRKKAQPEEPQRLPRTPKGKAAKLHKSRASRDASKRRWAAMSEDEKAVVAARIAGSVKARHAAKTPEERAAHEEQLAAARQRIDHTVRKARQKEALAAYWTPERRKAFGDKVRARRQAESTK